MGRRCYLSTEEMGNTFHVIMYLRIVSKNVFKISGSNWFSRYDNGGHRIAFDFSFNIAEFVGKQKTLFDP